MLNLLAGLVCWMIAYICTITGIDQGAPFLFVVAAPPLILGSMWLKLWFRKWRTPPRRGQR